MDRKKSRGTRWRACRQRVVTDGDRGEHLVGRTSDAINYSEKREKRYGKDVHSLTVITL